LCRSAPDHPPTTAIIVSIIAVALSGSEALLDCSMTKGGIHAFTRSWPRISFLAASGSTRWRTRAVWTPLNPSDKEAKDISEFGSDTPMKGQHSLREIAPAHVFLPSPQSSSCITDQIVPIIGGYSQTLLLQLEEFFVSYNGQRGKRFRVTGIGGPRKALKLVKTGIKHYKSDENR
jgi:hypothetical protein